MAWTKQAKPTGTYTKTSKPILADILTTEDGFDLETEDSVPIHLEGGYQRVNENDMYNYLKREQGDYLLLENGFKIKIGSQWSKVVKPAIP